MNWPGIAISMGCVFAGLVLAASAIARLRTGVTLSGVGGPRGPIGREDRPGQFWFLFWGRVVLGPAATIGGIAGLAHVL